MWAKSLSKFDFLKKSTFTGGRNSIQPLRSTEIINYETTTIRDASPMNMHRWGHGIGVLTIRNKDELIIFGGMSAFTGLPMDSIEAYDANTQTWKTIGKKLSKPKQTFGYLTIKEDDLHRLPFSTTKMIGKASETLVDLFTYFSGF